MNATELATILADHAAWLSGSGGKRADLRRANLHGAYLSNAYLSNAVLSGADLSGADLSDAGLSGADLSDADLSNAYLSNANLSGADLSGAYLSDAYLSNANLHGAYLSNAYLSNADLSNANLSGADLSDTCLSSDLHAEQRAFCRACPPIGRHGGRIVYRTAQSKFVGNTCYLPGHTYVAPVLSFSCETACHPGIYAGSLEWMQNASGTLVRCYVRDGDWVITAKGAIRCKRLRVLSKVTA